MGILERRAERVFCVLAEERGIDRPAAEKLMCRVFADLVHFEDAASPPTRKRTPKDLWQGDAEALAFVEVFSRHRADAESAVRLLVCGREGDGAGDRSGAPGRSARTRETVEVAQEALLRDPDPAAARLHLLACLTAPGRTWITAKALGDWVHHQPPALARWLEEGLGEVLQHLARDDAVRWFRRRLGIGDLMAALGDRRPGVGLDADGLPDIAWVTIPAGPFVWQDGERRTIEWPYRIARYPITNAQYQAFVDAKDYQDDAWWQPGASKPACPWRRDQPNRPRVAVDWFEATAYCRWLDARLRAAGRVGPNETVRLPTEPEGERAARGTHGREYPWGADPRPGYANWDEAERGPEGLSLRETTAVGLYPQGASPEGLLDCAGNVWEWCLDRYGGESGNAGRALRGGSWNKDPALARAAARYWLVPNVRLTPVGFREVCACPIPLNTEPLNTDH